MPKASLTVLKTNNLYVEFNDTLYVQEITKDDLLIRIFGSAQSYEFSWTAQFIDNSSVGVTMNILSNIIGQNNEQVVIDFS